jgi:hypothetical protein
MNPDNTDVIPFDILLEGIRYEDDNGANEVQPNSIDEPKGTIGIIEKDDTTIDESAVQAIIDERKCSEEGELNPTRKYAFQGTKPFDVCLFVMTLFYNMINGVTESVSNMGRPIKEPLCTIGSFWNKITEISKDLDGTIDKYCSKPGTKRRDAIIKHIKEACQSVPFFIATKFCSMSDYKSSVLQKNLKLYAQSFFKFGQLFNYTFPNESNQIGDQKYEVLLNDFFRFCN